MSETSANVRVRYVETDQMGVVHHSVYFHWMEVGRTEYLRNKGLSYAKMEEMGIRMPLIEANAEYLSPARYDDEIAVKTVLKESSQISFTFCYEIERVKDRKLLAKGLTRHIATDKTNRPKRVSKDIYVLIGGNIAEKS
jgi:acyl-CoA thioester hydrolase